MVQKRPTDGRLPRGLVGQNTSMAVRVRYSFKSYLYEYPLHRYLCIDNLCITHVRVISYFNTVADILDRLGLMWLFERVCMSFSGNLCIIMHIGVIRYFDVMAWVNA